MRHVGKMRMANSRLAGTKHLQLGYIWQHLGHSETKTDEDPQCVIFQPDTEPKHLSSILT